MINYASIMVSISAVLLTLEGSEGSIAKLMNYWKYLKEHFPGVYGHLRYRSLASFFAYKNPTIRKITTWGYRVVKKLYKFN